MQKNFKTKTQKANILVLPAFIIVAIITQVPFIITIILSFVKWTVIRPDLGIKFAGIDNYIKIFTSASFYTVVFNTLLIIFASLILCTILGIALSLLLDRKFPGINIVRTLIIAPFFEMDAVIGIIWKTLILHPSFGWNGYFSMLFNVKPVDFLGLYSMVTVIMLIVWEWTPFFVLIILAGLQGISEEIVESSKIDGANGFQTLFFIKLPSIINYIQISIILGLVFILKVFGIIFVTSFGGPGESSTNLPFYVYKIAFFGWDVGKAAAVATVMGILASIAISALFKFLRKRFIKIGG